MGWKNQRSLITNIFFYPFPPTVLMPLFLRPTGDEMMIGGTANISTIVFGYGRDP
jgi:hypothetical protein